MKISTNVYYQGLALLLVGLVVSSCSAFSEAYHDRVCWEQGSIVPLQCGEAFMPLSCPEDIVTANNQRIAIHRKLALKQVEGYSSPKVGELFSQQGSIPIFIEGVSPWLTLHNDLKKILSTLGYDVLTDTNGSDLIVESDITLLDVRSKPGRWFELKGTTHATASFKIIMQQINSKKLWSQEFTGEHKMKVSYVLLSDAEKALSEAYCQALRKFSDTVQRTEFHSRIK